MVVRYLQRAYALAGLLGLLSILMAASAHAAPIQLAVSRGDTGGTIGPLNTVGDDLCAADPTSGCDFSLDDDLVRNNDGVSYVFSVQVDPPGDNVTLTTQLQPGLVWDSLPTQCNPLTSSLTGDGSATSPSLLVCNLGFQSAYAEDLNFVARVLGDNPNGTTSGLASAEFGGPDSPSIIDDLSAVPDVTLTSAPRLNLRKSLLTFRSQTVNGVLGVAVFYTYWLETWQQDTNGNPTDDPNPLLGNEVVTQPITFTEDLSAISPNAFVAGCSVNPGTSGTYPLSPFNPADPDASVLDAGTNSCSATGPTATGSVTVTHTGADLSLSHSPSAARNGTPFPADRRIAAFGTIQIHIPQTDFAAAAGSLTATNTILGFDPTSISGQPNFVGADQNPADDGLDSTAEDKSDNQHSRTFTERGGIFSHTYRCSIPAVPAHNFCSATNSAGPNAIWLDAPTSASAVWSGDGGAQLQQPFGSYTFFRNGGFSPVTNLEDCTVIDSSLYEVADYAPGVGAECVSTCGVEGVDYVLEYGVGYVNPTWPPATGTALGTEVADECSAPPSAWHSTTTDARAVGPITKVRLRRLTPLNAGLATALATNLQVLPSVSDPSGTLLESWGSYRSDQFEPDWRDCRYNSGAHPAPAQVTNGCGDRLFLSRSLARIQKTTIPGDEVNTISAGGSVGFELRPSFTSETGTIQDNVDIVDLLPPQFEYVPNSATQGGTAFEPTITGTIATGQTLTWPLGNISTNVAITPIQFRVQTPLTTPMDTTLNNVARIDALTDASTDEQRSAFRNVIVAPPASMLMGKTVDQVLVDRDAGFEYTVEYLNSSSVDFNEIQVIDVLPFVGDARTPASNFSGTTTLGTVTPQSTNAQLYFTKDGPAGLSSDPSDPVNDLATGSVNWCASTPTYGVDASASPTIGGASTDCPANGTEVTALRVLDSQPLPAATPRNFSYQLIPSGNLAGDVYTNQAQAMADVITLRPRTPFATTTVIQDPSIGTAKSVTSATAVGDGSFDVVYNLVVTNLGPQTLHDIKLTDDLTLGFGTAASALADVDQPGEFIVNQAPVISINSADPLSTVSTFTGAATTIDLLDVAAGGSLTAGESVTLSFGLRFYPDMSMEPFNNQTQVIADTTNDSITDDKEGVVDLSDDGIDPDPDKDGSASGPGEDDPTPLMIPLIGVAKEVTSVVDLGGAVFRVTFDFQIANLSAVENATNVQLTDNLAAAFPAPVSYSNIAVTGAGVTPNPGFDGSGDINLLTGSDNISPLGSATLTLVIDVVTGGNNGPFSNTATVTTADTAGGPPTATDVSDDGSLVDSNGDGSAGGPDENDPTLISLPQQELGLAKQITAATQIGPTTFDITYVLAITNLSSDVAATNVQIEDNLLSTFPGAVSIAITAAPTVSGGLTAANPAFDGASNQSLLAGNEALAIGASATVSFIVRVDLAGIVGNGPFNNTATATSANTPGGPPISSDASDDGNDPQTSNSGSPNDTGGFNDPTPFKPETQSIGVAKNLSSVVEVSSGVFDVTFDLLVSNLSATTTATNLQLTDDLSTTFNSAASFVVQSLSAPNLALNTAFDGSADTKLLVGTETLAVGQSESVNFVVRVDTGSSLGPYSNQATGTSAATPGGAPVASDLSDDGTNPDANGDGLGGGTVVGDPENDPTVFQLPPQQISLAKQLVGQRQIGPNAYELDYSLVVANPSTTEDTTNVQISDDLAQTFPSVTSITITTGPTVTGALSLANSGFNGEADTLLLTGTETLASNAQATITFTVTVDFGAQTGTFLNSATASAANTPGGPAIVTDTSDDGSDPIGSNSGSPGDTGSTDDPTPVTLDPQTLGLAKDLVSVVEIAPTEFDVTFDLLLNNLSASQAATNVQIVEDLNATFSGANSWSLTSATPGTLLALNPNYDGNTDTNLLAGTDTLATGASDTIRLLIRVDTGGFNGPYSNQANASSSATPGGPPIASDASDAGTNPDSNGNGNSSEPGEDDPNVFQLPPQEIGIAKRVADFRQLQSTEYEIDFELVVANLSTTEAATNVQVTDNLVSAFPGVASIFVKVGSLSTGALTAAGNFDGIANLNILTGSDTLAIGQSEIIRFTVVVDFTGGTPPFLNQAEATVANSPDGPPINSDMSDSGTAPDGTNPGAPGDTGSSDDPTPIEIPSASLDKSASPAINISGPLYDLSYTLVVRNTGTVELTNIALTDDLASALAPATLVGTPVISSSGFSGGGVNSGFDGAIDTNLLTSNVQLPVGGVGTVTIDVRFSNQTGAPGTVNTAQLVSDQTQATDSQAAIATISQDSDGDGVPDDLETGDRDGDGIPDAQDFDPMGYFYCEDNGEILPGGRIEVRTPSGAITSALGTTNGVTLTQDGSDGAYRFFYDGTPGVYEIVIAQLPPRGVLSTTRLPAGVLDVSTVGTDPVILGSSEFGTTNFLADFSAPTNTPFYLELDFDSGDPDVLLNNIPLTGCAGGTGSISLGKTAVDETVVVGDFASYTLTLTNNESFSLTDVTVNDLIPPGFAFVEDSAQISRGGIEAPISVSGTRPIIFNVGRLEASEEVQITYLLRTGAGVVQGNYVNTAIAQIAGTDGSNEASARVEVVDDPLINITRIVGKVWHDRDGDGWQDSARATDIKLYGGPYGEKRRRLGNLPGRTSESLNLTESTMTDIVIDDWQLGDPLYLITDEGSRFTISRNGLVEADHFGQMKRGMTAQDLRISVTDNVLTIVNHGIQEEGVAGARLATVEGWVIETDQHGRYHIEAIDNVKFDIGSNYIVKLDKASLPDRSRFTTENPRVERLTQGLMSDIDFGVQLNQPLQLSLAEQGATAPAAAAAPAAREIVTARTEQAEVIRFARGNHEVSAEQLNSLQERLNGLEGKRNLRLEFLGHTDNERLSQKSKALYGNNQKLSEHRARETAAYVIDKLGLPADIAEIQGFGATVPVASNESNAGRAQNRRVEVLISYDDVRTIEEPPTITSATGASQGVDQTVSRLQTVNETVNSRVSEVRFASGKHAISSDQIRELREQLAALNGKKNVRVRFGGHTDNEPMGAPTRAIYQNNLGLSEYRARESAFFVAGQLDLTTDQVEIVAYGDSVPIASNDTAEGRALNRRVEIDILYDEQRKELVTETISRVVTLPTDNNGSNGIVRATDDQALADPRLAFVSEYTTVSRKDDVIKVHAYSNYPAYLETLTLEVYANHDHDFDRPIFTDTVSVDHRFDISKTLQLPVSNLVPGETYQYRLVATNKAGFKDVTRARTFQMVDPNKVSTDREPIGPEGIFGISDLEQQTIPVPAGRIRIVGQDIDPQHSVQINSEPVLLDDQGSFVLEAHLPPGNYQIPVSLLNGTDQGAIALERDLELSIGDSYLFMVGLANVTFGGSDISGNIEAVQADDRFSSDTYTSGRLAFYLKGKVKGKYLVTAQLDTTEDELNELGDNIRAKDPTSIFRRLEPDQFYPIYGDDSTLRSDTDSQGAFYVRVDWDKSKALWGNFNTGLTANEFAQYNRSLYGAQLVYQLPRYTEHNESRFSGELFLSEPQTVAAHNEFTATGGSLYYLDQTDIVRGSEKIWVEIRRRGTTQVLETIPLQPGRDYQFDQFQGRVILNRPLDMVSRDHFANIVRDDSLEGDDVFLLADFEYIARNFDADDLTLGAAGTAWITDSLGLGGTYVRESRAGDDYELKGLDLTLRRNKGTYLKLEVAESDAVAATSQRSVDGGLNFENIAPTGNNVSGRAWGAEAQVTLGKSGAGERGKVRAWYKDRDAEFSSSRESSELTDTVDTGIEANVRLNDRVDVIARASEFERSGLSTDRTLSVQGNARIAEKFNAALEGRYEERRDESGAGLDSEAVLAGGRIGYKPNESDEIYVEGQTVIDDQGTYEANERITLGAYRTFSEKFGAGLEVSEGSRGQAITGLLNWQATDAIALNLESGFGRGASSTAGATLNLADDYQVYGSYGIDSDRTLGRSRKVSTIGQRKSFGNRLTLFNEHQWIHGQYESVASDVFGIDLGLGEHWKVSTSLQTNDTDVSGQNTNRRAATLGLSYQKDQQRLGATLERRIDETGVNEFEQWLFTGAFEYKFNDAWRSVSRLNWSETDDEISGGRAARFTEGSVGFAYRPVNFDRWNMLARYTYLFDLVSPDQQVNRPDQESHVGSLEVLFDATKRWEFGAKLAIRRSRLRIDRDTGPWFENGVNLAVARARYHVNHKWDGLIEYRYLETVEFDDSRGGALVGLYRHLGGNLKLGAGYNFTDYSDDLTNLDYDGGGWYVDLIGKW